MKTAIITGASSGIGYEFVKMTAKAYPSLDQIWVIARRRHRLEKLREEIGGKIEIITLDLTDRNAVIIFKSMLEDERPDIKLVINAAGYGKLGAFSDIPVRDQLGMIDLNCRALTELTWLCLPYMKKNSRFIQVASAAAFVPQPDTAVYAASKAYVLSFTRAVNRELRERGIWMTAVCPGPVDTEFFAVAEATGYSASDIKQLFKAKADQVAVKALRDSSKKKEISVYGLPMKGLYVLLKIVPHKMVLSVMEQLF